MARGSLQGVSKRRWPGTRNPPTPGRRRCACNWGAWALVTALLAAPAVANPYAEHSDEELNRVASDWEALNSEERRDVFVEMRRRMAEDGRAQSMPVEVRRRFGRTIRRPDGSVVRIEQVVRVRSRATRTSSGEGPNESPDESPEEGPDDYGKGFEQRVERTEASGDTPAAQAVKVNKTVDTD